MKKLLLLLAVGGAATTTARAQTSPQEPGTAPTTIIRTVPPAGGLQQTPEGMVNRRVQYLTEELALTPDQQTRLKPMILAQREQLQALKAGRTTGGRRYGSPQDMKAAEAKFDEQFKTVLSPEQFSKYTQMKEAQVGKLPGGRRPVRPGARPAAPAPTE